ncbi:hypothetical protein RYH56_001930 [Citrobacter freundii]|nr:hypothetical protein [Citrobacter freundii]ELZ3334890.1 hypothetical protein [Klebsiella pneumoniae]ELF4150862.1 hypothetical protein [Citrobacter freundii]ELJ5792877.1 hypothetical protein [Citrobacter freundii]ELM6923875.1 hypothetical protein [Citrobacter freundii]
MFMKTQARERLKYLHIFPLAVIVWASFAYRSDITSQDLEPLISILQNVSVMVFTIMGIWIAYLYPNAILRITQPSKVDAIFSNEDSERVKVIVGVVVLSAIVLSLLLIGVVLKPFIIKSWLFINAPTFFVAVGIFSLLILSYLQLIALYIVIASNVNFIVELKNKRNKRDLNDRL